MAARRSLPRNLRVLSSAVLAPATTSSFTVGRGLPRSGALALPRGHALNLVHATSGRTPAIAKTLDASKLHSLGKAADQARDDAYHVPQ